MLPTKTTREGVLVDMVRAGSACPWARAAVAMGSSSAVDDGVVVDVVGERVIIRVAELFDPRQGKAQVLLWDHSVSGRA